MAQCSIQRPKSLPPHTIHRHKLPHSNSTLVSWIRSAVCFVYFFNEVQCQERGKTSLKTQRVTPNTQPRNHSLYYRRSFAMPAAEVILFLPISNTLSHYEESNSASICLWSQSSDGTDATGTSLQNTHWSDCSKVRLFYVYLWTHDRAQNSHDAV